MGALSLLEKRRVVPQSWPRLGGEKNGVFPPQLLKRLELLEVGSNLERPRCWRGEILGAVNARERDKMRVAIPSKVLRKGLT